MSSLEPNNIQVCGRVFRSFSRPEIHPVVSELLSSSPHGRVLDFPCGSGALTWRLHNDGHEVTGADISPEAFENPDLKVVQADLQLRFPFEDNSFDYACFVEGPEHVENVFHCLREFSRILKADGILILTIPNYSNLEHRLKTLFSGASEPMTSFDQVVRDLGGNVHMLHINRLTFPMLKTALEFSGFSIEALARDKQKRKQMLLWPLAVLIHLVSFMSGQRHRNKYWVDANNANTVLMGGNTLIVKARNMKSVCD